MENQEIIQLLELHASLLELHEANPFKIRSYQTAVFHLEKVKTPIADMSEAEVKKIAGIGKGIAEKISEINQNGSFADLDELLKQTPTSLLEFFKIKGLGAKKIRTIWKELNISTPEQLLEACENNQIAELKGFGEKTQEAIKHNLMFVQFNADKLLYAEAAPYAEQLLKFLKEHFTQVQVVGQLRRQLEVVDTLQVVVATDTPVEVFEVLNTHEAIEQNTVTSSPFIWRGNFKANVLSIEIITCKEADFASKVFITSASKAHLGHTTPQGTLLQAALTDQFDSEEALYEAVQLPYISPVLREGLFEFDLVEKKQLPERLIQLEDLKGVLHNHSTYSDGKHTLEEMAKYCKELGYAYLGMSDHSKSAFYANGLYEKRVAEQQAEIDQLNQQLAPFKIFKGIESDILADGSLDYHDDILKTFDFIVASVHANISSDKNNATERIVKAVENPYTTILGHPTGRLLLRREGYPLDMEKVLDACAANGVAIEINAHPVRLDLDWRWVHQALEKGIWIAINPDAHEKKGYHNMQYGTLIGQKGGLTKERCLNAMNLEEFTAWLAKRK
ncbi:MAG: PHP domain-containing protein [Thermonemataceae bacterium]